MQAATYTARGPAAEVLRVRDIPTPSPQAGEVLVQIAYSGVNPSDVKSRAAAAAMDFPLVVPHSDGAGRITAVGAGVPAERVGHRVWLYNGQWRRPFGTAAEYVCLPAEQAVDLSDGVDELVGASIGIPLMTAYHAVASLGSLLGKTVLVPGAVGSVGMYVTQLAKRAGARVIAMVSSDEKAALAKQYGADATVDYRGGDVLAQVKALTHGEGVDAIIEVDAAGNARHYAGLLRFGGQVVVYGSSDATIGLPFRPMIMGFARLYFFIVYLLPQPVLRETIAGVTALLADQALKHPPTRIYPLAEIAQAHAQVERGANAKVLISL
ncbi:MAG TPA: NADPH:quinone reductase [Ideonella sp.]|jgi:NADPH2:quinone reductase|nr:NADPH:quinone reductase [Ideonella sp.]